MYRLKLLFQKLQIRSVLAPGKTADLLEHCRRLLPGDNWSIRAFVFQREMDDHMTTHPWEQLTAQGRNVAASFTQSSLNFKALTAPCLFPATKMLAWKEKTR